MLMWFRFEGDVGNKTTLEYFTCDADLCERGTKAATA